MARRNSTTPQRQAPDAGARTRERHTPVVAEREQSTSMAHFRAEFFEGPLPHPETLAKYDQISPGAASRILAMAEEQSKHRQELEKMVVLSNCRSQDRGPIFGFILALSVIIIGASLLFTGREIAGLVALVAALAAVVVPFITGKRAQQEELAEKRRELAGNDDESWDYSDLPDEKGKNIEAGSSRNRPRS